MAGLSGIAAVELIRGLGQFGVLESVGSVNPLAGFHPIAGVEGSTAELPIAPGITIQLPNARFALGMLDGMALIFHRPTVLDRDKPLRITTLWLASAAGTPGTQLELSASLVRVPIESGAVLGNLPTMDSVVVVDSSAFAANQLFTAEFFGDDGPAALIASEVFDRSSLALYVLAVKRDATIANAADTYFGDAILIGSAQRPE